MNDHTHEWTETPVPLGTIDAYTCTECGETCATCNACQRPTGTALLACDPCLEHQGRILTDIERAVGHHRWAPGSGQLAATRYDRVRVRGTGSDSTGASISAIGDVAEVLASWAGMWAEALKEEPPADLRGVLDYLRGHIIWAAHHGDVAAWDDYREELRALRHHARRISGLLPQREAAPCVYCGSDVVRDWADARWDPLPGGLADELRCTGCDMTWDGPRWDFTKRTHLQALPHVRPEQLVTFEDLRLIWPTVPRQTMRAWIDRDRKAEEENLRDLDQWEERRRAYGPEPERPATYVRRIPEVGWNERGVPLYRVADVAELVDRRADTTRRGRRAADIA